MYQLLADGVVALHFLWILFLITGGWWGRKYPAVARVHIAGLVFACLVEGFDWFCPLTDLEVWLRRLGAQPGYRGSFLTHYLNQVIYLDLPHGLVVLLTLALAAGNAWLYLSKPKP